MYRTSQSSFKELIWASPYCFLIYLTITNVTSQVGRIVDSILPLCTPHCTAMALTYEINSLPEAYSSSIWTILGCKGVFGKLHGMTFLAF